MTLWPSDSMVSPGLLGGSAARPPLPGVLHLLPATPTTKSLPLFPAILDGSALGFRAGVLKDVEGKP